MNCSVLVHLFISFLHQTHEPNRPKGPPTTDFQTSVCQEMREESITRKTYGLYSGLQMLEATALEQTAEREDIPYKTDRLSGHC